MLATIAPLPVEHTVDPDMLPGILRRTKKLGGNVAAKFGEQDGQPLVLPERFAALKREICKDPELFTARWRSVLIELEKETELIVQNGGDVSTVVALAMCDLTGT